MQARNDPDAHLTHNGPTLTNFETLKNNVPVFNGGNVC